MAGETIRKALDQTSWEAASDLVTSWTAARRVGAIRPDIPTIDKAIEKYLADAAARRLNAATLQKKEEPYSTATARLVQREGVKAPQAVGPPYPARVPSHLA